MIVAFFIHGKFVGISGLELPIKYNYITTDSILIFLRVIIKSLKEYMFYIHCKCDDCEYN